MVLISLLSKESTPKPQELLRMGFKFLNGSSCKNVFGKFSIMVVFSFLLGEPEAACFANRYKVRIPKWVLVRI